MLLDADSSGQFPDVQSLLSHASAKCNGRYSPFEMAAIAISWGIVSELTTPTPPAWHPSRPKLHREALVFRIKRDKKLYLS